MDRPRSRLLPVAAATFALCACSTDTHESPSGSAGDDVPRRAEHVVAGADRAFEGESETGLAPMPVATAAVREPVADTASDAGAVAVKEQGSASTIPMPPPPTDSHGPVVRAGAERYASIDPNPVRRTADEPVSTFSIDVDTGSYANVRRLLGQGTLPPAGAVRVEELVNYFDYDYPVPDDPTVPFSVTTTLAPTPWNADTELLRIGIRGLEPEGGTGPANLVFLVDTSGSMNSPDKLGLLKSSLSLLARGLGSEDRVSIVTYAGSAGTVLDGVAGDDVEAIDAALDGLAAGGGTNGEAGILSAYRLARQHRAEGGTDRVILATDGDFNVGLADTEALVRLIEREREAGVALTTLGFGTGNYDDELMERLADAGNGNHAYIDTLSEARKVLAEQLAGTLFTIAGDVKIQLELNPAVVAQYRLLGYENRVLAEEDFTDDAVDAGEIGAGHRVTALYELARVGSPGWMPERRYGAVADEGVGGADRSDELGELRLRWKLPGEARSEAMAVTIDADATLDSLAAADDDFRFAAAVAAWGELLRDGRLRGATIGAATGAGAGGETGAGDDRGDGGEIEGGVGGDAFGHADVRALARGARGEDAFGHRSAFLELVGLAEVLDSRRHAP